MRLTATDKAIGELSMRKADLCRAQLIIEQNGADNAMKAIADGLSDLERCIDLLRSVAPAPKPEKAAKVAKSKRRGKANGAMEVEA